MVHFVLADGIDFTSIPEEMRPWCWSVRQSQGVPVALISSIGQESALPAFVSGNLRAAQQYAHWLVLVGDDWPSAPSALVQFFQQARATTRSFGFCIVLCNLSSARAGSLGTWVSAKPQNVDFVLICGRQIWDLGLGRTRSVSPEERFECLWSWSHFAAAINKCGDAAAFDPLSYFSGKSIFLGGLGAYAFVPSNAKVQSLAIAAVAQALSIQETRQEGAADYTEREIETKVIELEEKSRSALRVAWDQTQVGDCPRPDFGGFDFWTRESVIKEGSNLVVRHFSELLRDWYAKRIAALGVALASARQSTANHVVEIRNSLLQRFHGTTPVRAQVSLRELDKTLKQVLERRFAASSNLPVLAEHTPSEVDFDRKFRLGMLEQLRADAAAFPPKKLIQLGATVWSLFLLVGVMLFFRRSVLGAAGVFSVAGIAAIWVILKIRSARETLVNNLEVKFSKASTWFDAEEKTRFSWADQNLERACRELLANGIDHVHRTLKQECHDLEAISEVARIGVPQNLNEAAQWIQEKADLYQTQLHLVTTHICQEPAGFQPHVKGFLRQEILGARTFAAQWLAARLAASGDLDRFLSNRGPQILGAISPGVAPAIERLTALPSIGFRVPGRLQRVNDRCWQLPSIEFPLSVAIQPVNAALINQFAPPED